MLWWISPSGPAHLWDPRNGTRTPPERWPSGSHVSRIGQGLRGKSITLLTVEAALLGQDHRAQQQIDRGNDQDDGDEDDDNSQHFHGNSPGRQVNCDGTTPEQRGSHSMSTVCRRGDLAATGR